jgi:hypothetical protein
LTPAEAYTLLIGGFAVAYIVIWLALWFYADRVLHQKVEE